MTIYYVDDGGSNTSPFDTWAKAAPTLAALQTAIGAALSTDGNIVYVGADSVSSGDGVGVAAVFAGPANGNVRIISATVGTTTYAKSSSNQVLVNGGDFKIEFNNGLSLYGIKATSTGMIKCGAAVGASGVNSALSTYECTFLPGGNRQVEITQSGSTPVLQKHHKLTIYPDKDSGSNNRQFIDLYGGITELIGLVLTNSASGRNGPLFSGLPLGAVLKVSGSDLSTIAAQSAVLVVSGPQGQAEFVNCKTLASPTWVSGALNVEASLKAINCQAADAPEGLYSIDYWGTIQSSTSEYRNSGASVEAIPCSWKMISAATAKLDRPLYSPWIYVPITAAGTKTFDIFVAQNGGAGDLTDADVWLEVEYMGTANIGTTTFAWDRALGDFSGTVQDDDVASSWTGITATYMQKLRVASVSVGEEGLARCRVGLGKASQTLYVDFIPVVS